VYVHAIFSTKDREPFLSAPEARERVHSFLGGVSKQLGCQPLVVGGVEDHVHILAALGRSISQADWIKELKRASSVMLKCEHPRFGWQSGYAIFSVDPSTIDTVRRYIVEQEAHHKEFSFKDELRALLKEHGVEWDEKYLWE
jgi:putative transposase